MGKRLDEAKKIYLNACILISIFAFCTEAYSQQNSISVELINLSREEVSEKMEQGNFEKIAIEDSEFAFIRIITILR